MKTLVRILTLSLLLIISSTNLLADSSGNNVYLLVDDTSGAGAGETIYIKQDGTDNWIGNSTSDQFEVTGTGNSVYIRQVGYTNDFYQYSTFDCTNCTLDVNIKGSDNRINLDMDDTGDTGWWLDVDIRGGDNIVTIQDSPNGSDVANQNYDIDIDGNDNALLFKTENNSGSGHHLYVYIYGDDNYVDYMMNDGADGMNTTANAAVGHYNSHNHGSVADPSLASIDFYIIGSSNSIKTETEGDSNYLLIELFNGSSNNRIDYTPSAYSAGFNRLMQIGDLNKMYLRVNGSTNRIGAYQAGGNNTMYLNVYTSSATVYASQTGGSNTANITVSGDSIYDYTLNFTQDGSDTCTYSFDRSSQSGDVTATVTNGC